MASVEKTTQKMKYQPNGISPQEADRVPYANGFSLLWQRGFHRSYRNDLGEMLIIVDATPLKAVYVKDILKRIGQ